MINVSCTFLFLMISNTKSSNIEIKPNMSVVAVCLFFQLLAMATINISFCNGTEDALMWEVSLRVINLKVQLLDFLIYQITILILP